MEADGGERRFTQVPHLFYPGWSLLLDLRVELLDEP